MDELYNMLSSGARINKKKKKKTNGNATGAMSAPALSSVTDTTSRRGDNFDASSSAATTRKRKHDDDDDQSSSSSSSDYDSHGVADDDERARKHNRHEEHKRQRVHREEVAAFRNRMKIRIGKPNRAEGANCPDPVSSFHEIKIPPWWKRGGTSAAAAASGGGGVCPVTREFDGVRRVILSNVERGRWREPTPIQMQCVPALLRRRDVLGAAPTGSGKTGAFVIPALFLASAPPEVFYGAPSAPGGGGSMQRPRGGVRVEKGEKKRKGGDHQKGRRGEIRTLLLAPSRELAAQLHREVERLGQGKRGGLRSALLSKANSRLIIEGKMGGRRGLDALVATPLRLCECLNSEGGGSSGVDLSGVRMVVLDEADRLLDASDGGGSVNGGGQNRDEAERRERARDALGDGAPSGDNGNGSGSDSDSDSDDSSGSSSSDSNTGEEESISERSSSRNNHNNSKGDERQQKGPSSAENKRKQSHAAGARQQEPRERQSGSAHAKTFLEQIDHILSACPPEATRALFSATVGPRVRSLAESILRNPVDVTITTTLQGANPDIEQKLTFVGREEGKLLAIRQLIQRGEIKPPVLVFLQSKERAQALFGELLYDGVNVDVLHAGRSRAARDESVAKFRKGDTWILICTDLVARGVDFKAVNMVINYDLPATGVSYVHRIGRCGRAGRKGTAVTLFTENDFENLRTVANVMRLSGCEVPDWMLTLKKKHTDGRAKNKLHYPSNPRRKRIDTVPSYDRVKRAKRIKSIENSKSKKKTRQRNDQGEA